MESYEQEIVDRIKNKILKKRDKVPFLETKLGVFLSTDWAEVMLDKLAYQIYLHKSKDDQSIQHTNVVYEAKPSNFVEGSMSNEMCPQMVEIDSEGKEYYTYSNNVTERHIPTYTLSSIFPSKDIQDEVMDYLDYLNEVERDNYNKKAFCAYLEMSEDEIIELTWEEIDEAILNKYIKTHRWKKRTLEVNRIC